MAVRANPLRNYPVWLPNWLPRAVQSARRQAEQIGLDEHEPDRRCHQKGTNRPEEHGDHDADGEHREPHPVASHEGRRLGAASGERRDGHHATNEGESGENQEGRCTCGERWHVVSVGVGQGTEVLPATRMVSLGSVPERTSTDLVIAVVVLRRHASARWKPPVPARRPLIWHGLARRPMPNVWDGEVALLLPARGSNPGSNRAVDQ